MTQHDPSASVHISTLTIVVGAVEDSPSQRQVVFLADGKDLASRGDFLGFDPDEILSARMPLLPEIAERVAVYQCSCSIAGCGVRAPKIERRKDGLISWSDFRDFTGVYDGPTVDRDPRGGRAVSENELFFDAGQYERAIREAAADRSWESELRITARLIEQGVRADSDRIAAAGYSFDWVSADDWTDGGDKWSMSLSSSGRRTKKSHQLVFVLSAPAGTPEERAAHVLARLRGDTVCNWATLYPHQRY